MKNTMQQLMNTDTKTMSSMEIAQLTQKDHADVLKDIRRILEEAEIDHGKFSGIFDILPTASKLIFWKRKIRSMNPDMKIDGKILGKVANIFNQPAKRVFDLYEQPVNTYTRTVWEEAYPDAELP